MCEFGFDDLRRDHLGTLTYERLGRLSFRIGTHIIRSLIRPIILGFRFRFLNFGRRPAFGVVFDIDFFIVFCSAKEKLIASVFLFLPFMSFFYSFLKPAEFGGFIRFLFHLTCPADTC